MKKLILTSVIVALVAFYAGLVVGYNMDRPEPATEPATEAAESKPLSKYEVGPPDAQEMLELVNEIRTDRGITALKYSKQLEASACAKNAHMIKKGYWDHYSPDGVSPWSFILEQGYGYNSASENLAVGALDTTSKSTVDSWMKSEKHKAGILRKVSTETGICVTKVQDFLSYGDSYLSTQHFAAPYTP